MQRYFKDRWIRDHDLADSPQGREDSPELIDKCWSYLTERVTGEHRIVQLSADKARKTRAELVTAHVRASVRLRPELNDLSRRLADAEATIDRLLAFVPGRAKELSDQRLDELMRQLEATAENAFPGKSVGVSAAPESDAESFACHRITVSIKISVDQDPATFAGGVTELHRWLAANTRPTEYQAVRLLVEPEVSVGT